MRSFKITSIVGLLALSASVWAGPAPSEKAPTFTGRTATGETVSLDQFAGKKVVLEWSNHGCPYVQKHYDTANMQSLQKKLTADDVVWLTVISSAPGKQGHVSGQEALALTQSRDAAPSHIILDTDGSIGRLYEAKTTPHMFLIDEEGVTQYMGAIDNKPSSRKRTVNSANNYLLAAYDAVTEGETPDPQSTKPYGCSVKY